MHGFAVGQVRVNHENRRIVFVIEMKHLLSPEIGPSIQARVQDLFDLDDIYWISPRKLGEPISEMEAIAWAAMQI